ncbi:hypothetical protein NL676_025533 [Syzygium grande]|nr:hypothetical protein NL676_025533 [Syzygium grande]
MPRPHALHAARALRGTDQSSARRELTDQGHAHTHPPGRDGAGLMRGDRGGAAAELLTTFPGDRALRRRRDCRIPERANRLGLGSPAIQT